MVKIKIMSFVGNNFLILFFYVIYTLFNIHVLKKETDVHLLREIIIPFYPFFCN